MAVPINVQNRVGPRNIILIIGDGMGPQQIALSELYWHRTHDARAQPLHAFIEQATHGVHLPLPHTALVNDSACAASQLAGGCQCEPTQVGMSFNGSRCPSVLREAKRRGMRVGLVSDTRITHATPAAFYGHVNNREREADLASQLVEDLPDLALSGGTRFFLPQTDAEGFSDCNQHGPGSRTDRRNLLSQVQAQGGKVICSSSELKKVKELPLLGLFASGHMANAFREGERNQPTLAQMTESALELLMNSDGFFLMVEAGQIDTAAHYNDAGWVLAEMLRLSSVLRVIDGFLEQHPDTLVVMTADHETGGMGLSYRRTESKSARECGSAHGIDFLSVESLHQLASQHISIADLLRRKTDQSGMVKQLRALQSELTAATGIALSEHELNDLIGKDAGAGAAHSPQYQRSFKESVFYPYSEGATAVKIARRVGEKQGVVWATGTHTSTPIGVMAKGPSAERFQGWMTTSNVGQRLYQLLAETTSR